MWQSRFQSMQHVNSRKRLAHKRAVQSALQQILNDPAVMLNADCEDLVVSVSRVEFGRTVREIYVDVFGRPRVQDAGDGESRHDKYMRQAKDKGDATYIDLTDMFVFPEHTAVIAEALQDHLGLRYTPEVH